tara:strand:- start:360 stop:515 length:156 start_codon:yes stop_codon:yes gene_type:complete
MNWKKYKLKTELNFVPYLGVGIGSQKTYNGRDFLLFLPFMTFELQIRKKYA